VHGFMQRLLLTLVVTLTMVITGCSSSASTEQSCSQVMDIWQKAESGFATDEQRVGQTSETYGTTFTRDQAKLAAHLVLVSGFAALWPTISNQDLKDTLKNLSTDSNWSANIIALRSICPFKVKYDF